VSEQGRFVSKDGTSLFWRSWVPEAPPRAAIAIVHGLAEHAGRYDHVGRHLARRGCAVYAIDYRGHGQSAGRRVHVDAFDEYVDDVGSLVALVKEKHPALPCFLLGHSQGGLIALLFVLRRPETLAGAIVSAPLLGVHPAARPGAVMKALAALLLRVAPRLVMPNPLDARLLSHDPAVGQAYDRDPLVSHAVSAGWFAALKQAQAEARAAASRLRVPTLVMSSGDDRIVDPAAAAAFAAAAPAGLVDYVRWPGLYHEMLNEPEALRAPVIARIEAWLDARLPA
jgi:alpha-beta hydrolase superfamily lysophospholipase